MKRIFLFSCLLFPISLFSQDWHWQNPLPQGNGLKDIHFFDESKAIAVGTAGTVLTTTDGGTSWTAQVSGTTYDLSSVFFTDAANGWAVGAVGTILHTSNGGGTWTSQTSGTTNDLSSVFFTDANTGWMVGGRFSPSASTIRHTTNGGTTWTTQAGGTPDWLHSVFFIDANTGWAVGETGTIIHTMNGGETWTFQIEGTSRCLYSVFFTDANAGWAAGHSGVIRRTTNGGTTWTAQTSGTTDHLHSVFFTDANTGWSVGAAGTIVQTTNGGTNWTPQSSGTTNQLESVLFTGPNMGWTVGDAGTTLHTTDGGGTWTSLTSGPTHWMHSLFFIDSNRGWAVGDLGTILHTSNGGDTWTVQASGTRRALYSVYFTDPNTGWAVGDPGIILHTTNGGGSWRDQPSGTTNDLSSVFFADLNTGWAVGDAGTSLYTTDGGGAWTAQASGTTHDLSSVFFIDATMGWAVGGGSSPSGNTVLHTTNGGATWMTQTSGMTYHLDAVFFTDANNGWAAGDSGSILHTMDGGGTWTAQTSGTTSSIRSIYFTDANNGWAAGDPGTILHTTDGGTTWTAQASGTANSMGRVFFSDANTGWVVGSGGAILHTTTGGTGIEPPAAPTLASPEHGSTVPVSPLLSWNAAPGANWYTVQISTSPFFITNVLNQTNLTATSHQSNGLEENITHYWRVSMTDASGTSGWSNTWSFTVGSAPNQVALVSPANGGVVTSDSAVFVWRQGFPLVDRYWFEYSTDPDFASATTDSSLSDTSTVVHNLQHHETYYWRVRAHNASGWGPEGDVWSFLLLNAAPATPLLVSPPDGVTDQSLTTTFTWRTVSSTLLRQVTGGTPDATLSNDSRGATDSVWYHLQLALDSGFGNLIVNDSTLIDSTAVVSSLGENTAYYWRVRARNLVGSGLWSEAWSFSTLGRPAQVVLAMPENGAIIGKLSTVCTWLQGTSVVDRYWFEWARDSLFAGSRVDTTVTDTTFSTSQLLNGETYYWKVRAHNEAGWGEFSESWRFTALITSVGDEEEIPVVYSLSQNYPNPFNPATTIRYGLPQQAHVMLEVFNMLGQRVAVLTDETQEAGYHEAIFERATLASGLYLYRLSAGEFVETRKLVLLR